MSFGRWFSLSSLALAALLAACSGSTTAPVAATTSCPAIGTLPVPPPVIYPPRAATAVPDGNFNIVLGYAYGGGVSVSAPGLPTIAAASPVPAPSPLPSSPVTPSPSSTPVAYAISGLQAKTTYTIDATFSTPGCPFLSALGTFTTQ